MSNFPLSNFNIFGTQVTISLRVETISTAFDTQVVLSMPATFGNTQYTLKLTSFTVCNFDPSWTQAQLAYEMKAQVDFFASKLASTSYTVPILDITLVYCYVEFNFRIDFSIFSDPLNMQANSKVLSQ